MTIIRNLRGSWPQWCVDLDDGRIVAIYIRWGSVQIGIAATETEAFDKREEVRSSPDYAGVVDVLAALQVLQELGYYYVCPTFGESRSVPKVQQTASSTPETDTAPANRTD